MSLLSRPKSYCGHFPVQYYNINAVKYVRRRLMIWCHYGLFFLVSLCMIDEKVDKVKEVVNDFQSDRSSSSRLKSVIRNSNFDLPHGRHEVYQLQLLSLTLETLLMSKHDKMENILQNMLNGKHWLDPGSQMFHNTPEKRLVRVAGNTDQINIT